jgi:mevalonate kinase
VDSLNRVVELVREGVEALLADDLEKLGEAMNRQQVEEHLMGTSTERLELFCRTARRAGAWGAKQMGAGGGGCAIALCPPERQEAVQSSLAAQSAPVWAFKVIDDPTASPEGCEERL